MLIVTEAIAYSVLCLAVQETARRLDCPDVEWRFENELMDEIQHRDETVYALLSDFIEAYQDWHSHLKIWDASGKLEALDVDEKGQLGNLMARRDESRNRLVGALKQIR